MKATITPEVHREIMSTVGTHPAETGGLLGGRLDGPITHFYFDQSARRTRAEYSPDTDAINRKLKEWPEDIRLRGFVHSHPRGFTRLSGADIEYATRMLGHNKTLPGLFLPIVQSAHDAEKFEMHGFQVQLRAGKPQVAPVDIEVIAPASENLPARIDTPRDMFDRVKSAYDIERLSESLVVMAGVGGGASFVDSMARTGIGHMVLIDPDTVSATNMATQHYYVPDIGRPKVAALADRVRNINPAAVTHIFQKRLEDITVEELNRIFYARRYTATLLVAMSDSFPAQAAANRLALSLRIPLLTAQMYPQGRAAEIVFTVPGVTPACMRCVLSSRYAHYANGCQNSVTSHGSPIFSGETLNSLAGFVALSILHHGTPHPRWGDLIRRAGKRNFIQLRLDPDVQEHLGLNIFDRVLGRNQASELFFGEAIWRPVDPDHPDNGFPHCPDCGGTGNLLAPMPGLGQPSQAGPG